MTDFHKNLLGNLTTLAVMLGIFCTGLFVTRAVLAEEGLGQMTYLPAMPVFVSCNHEPSNTSFCPQWPGSADLCSNDTTYPYPNSDCNSDKKQSNPFKDFFTTKPTTRNVQPALGDDGGNPAQPLYVKCYSIYPCKTKLIGGAWHCVMDVDAVNVQTY